MLERMGRGDKKRRVSEKAAKRGAASAINPLPAREGKTTPKSNEDTYITERAPPLCVNAAIYIIYSDVCYTHIHTSERGDREKERRNKNGSMVERKEYFAI